jgi:hypothetical protein
MAPKILDSDARRKSKELPIMFSSCERSTTITNFSCEAAQLGPLVSQARELAKNGNHAGAVKWLEWTMKEIADGNFDILSHFLQRKRSGIRHEPSLLSS